MADKKQKAGNADPAEHELEQHVDQIMDPKLPDPKPEPSKGPPALPEIDIFENSDKPAGIAQETDAQPPSSDAPSKDKGSDQTINEEIVEDTSIDDATADPLVDDIVAHESDQLLAVQDAAKHKADAIQKPSLRERMAEFITNWWQNKPARYSTLAVLALLLLTAGIVPTSRYFVLNTTGVRVSAKLLVTDSTTDLPLKNVTVTIGNKSGTTNQEGTARLEDLKLGDQTLTIQRLGFAKVTKSVTLGLGSNPLEDVSLRAVGAQYTFRLNDFLSGKPLKKNGEVSSGEATARVDEKGTAVLTIGDLDTPTFTVTVKAGGYRTEKVVIANTTTQATTVAMVSQRKEVYVSKQSGKYDVYKIDIDGKNKQLLLAGSGRERDQMTLVPHQTDETVALVSSRDDKRNQDGYLLDTLSLINVTNGNVTTLEHSERIQIVDWIGDRLIYVKIKAGTSGGNNERNQLMSYNYSTTNRQVLASANNFSDIVSAKGVLYYASFYNGSTQPQFAKINPDNTGKQTILTTNIWDIIRTSYDDLYLASSDVWYSYRLGDATARKLDKAPSNPNDTRFYLDAPGSKRALWTESRDGKGVLLTYDATTRKDTTLVSQAGLTYPLRWLDSRTVTYRVSTQQESATYAVSVDGGAPRKIVDVTNVSGLGRWYYGYY